MHCRVCWPRCKVNASLGSPGGWISNLSLPGSPLGVGLRMARPLHLISPFAAYYDVSHFLHIWFKLEHIQLKVGAKIPQLVITKFWLLTAKPCCWVWYLEAEEQSSIRSYAIHTCVTHNCHPHHQPQLVYSSFFYSFLFSHSFHRPLNHAQENIMFVSEKHFTSPPLYV